MVKWYYKKITQMEITNCPRGYRLVEASIANSVDKWQQILALAQEPVFELPRHHNTHSIRAQNGNKKNGSSKERQIEGQIDRVDSGQNQNQRREFAFVYSLNSSFFCLHHHPRQARLQILLHHKFLFHRFIQFFCLISNLS